MRNPCAVGQSPGIFIFAHRHSALAYDCSSTGNPVCGTRCPSGGIATPIVTTTIQ